MKVTLPVFNITLALKEPNRQPNTEDLEILRKSTAKYLCLKLKPEYPKLFGLDLEFSSLKCDLYHSTVYFEVESVAHFPISSKKSEFSGIFNSMALALDGNYNTTQQNVGQVLLAKKQTYLDQAVCSADNILWSTATNVKVGMGRKQEEGGLVQSPTFSLSFVCTKEPEFWPTSRERNHLLFLTQKAANMYLKTTYPSNFQEVTLKVKDTEIGGRAGKPNTQFNLYVEFDAAASFLKDPLSSKELFQALASGVVSSSYIKNVQSIGGPFSKVSYMAINSCKRDDGELVMPKESDMGPYKKVGEPVKLPAANKPSKNGDEFYQGQANIFVLLQIPGHREPQEADYEALATITCNHYAAYLQKEYGDMFQDIDVSVGKATFGPDQRDGKDYNVCVLWDISTTFDPNGRSSGKKEVPSQFEIASCLVKADTDKYFKLIRNLSKTSFMGTSRFFIEQVNSSKL